MTLNEQANELTELFVVAFMQAGMSEDEAREKVKHPWIEYEERWEAWFYTGRHASVEIDPADARAIFNEWFEGLWCGIGDGYHTITRLTDDQYEVHAEGFGSWYYPDKLTAILLAMRELYGKEKE